MGKQSVNGHSVEVLQCNVLSIGLDVGVCVSLLVLPGRPPSQASWALSLLKASDLNGLFSLSVLQPHAKTNGDSPIRRQPATAVRDPLP